MATGSSKRKVIYFRNYFSHINDTLTEKVKEKVDYVLYVVAVAGRIPKKLFKYVEGTDGLFKIRIDFESNFFRIFCCFDERHLRVLFDGFQKKAQKTPRKEIENALKIKKEYFKYKKRN